MEFNVAFERLYRYDTEQDLYSLIVSVAFTSGDFVFIMFHCYATVIKINNLIT